LANHVNRCGRAISQEISVGNWFTRAGKVCPVLKIITTPTDKGPAAWAAHGPCAPSPTRERMPHMTTTFTAQPRRQAPAASRPPRELPVLFHLMDVSRPRGYAASSQPTLSEAPAEYALSSRLPSPEPPAGEPSVSSSLAAEFDLEMAASLAETGGMDAAPAAAIPANSTKKAAATEGAAESEGASEPASASNAELTNSLLETPAPVSSDDAVSLRQRAEERQRKRAAAARDDWFSTHGKFIAIGFVICLVATIFLARMQRKPAGPPVAGKHSHHDHDHALPATKAPTKTIKSASAELPVEEPKSGASPAVAISGVKPAPAAETSQTALHPPTIPQLPAQPGGATTTDDSLFPWSKPGEERVATRTDAPASAAAPSPESQPQYPTTTFGGNYQSASPSPAAPSIAPVSPGDSIYGPALSAPDAPAYSPSAGEQPSYPTTNSASGYRYERTGSGLH
jgi:hypothetical protein